MMGSKLAPNIFHRLSQAVRRMMIRKGFSAIIAYIDDFWLVAPSFAECDAALQCLLVLLRKLGFQINWKKVVDPTQTLTFLGVEIDPM